MVEWAWSKNIGTLCTHRFRLFHRPIRRPRQPIFSPDQPRGDFVGRVRRHLSANRVVMTESGDKMNCDGHESFWGISLQNLVVLCALDELYRAVIIDL